MGLDFPETRLKSENCIRFGTFKKLSYGELVAKLSSLRGISAF